MSTEHSEFFKRCSVSAVTEDLIPTNKPIKNIKQDVNFMALDKFEEMNLNLNFTTLSCASFLVRFYFFISDRFMAYKNWLPRQFKEELLVTHSPSVIFKFILLDIQLESSSFITARAHKEIKHALANMTQKI